jgi:hypothetical protein
MHAGLISRCAGIGAALAGLVGGVLGLVIGLAVNPPTAWFAVFEVGIPASILGGLVGWSCGAIAYAVRRRNGRSN